MFLTKSRINSYLICPARYEFEYIEKIPTEPTIELEIGKTFHRISHEFYGEVKKLMESGESSSELGSKMYWKGIPHHFPSVIEKLVGETKLPLDNLLKNFIEYETKRWGLVCEYGYDKIPEYFFPTHNELRLRSEELQLSGIVDRVFKDTDNTLILLELKTGNYPTKKISLKSLQRELAIYFMLCEKNNIIIDRWGGYYPKSNDLWIEDVNKRAITSALKDMEKVRKGISGKRFPRVIDSGYGAGICKWCPFTNKCLFGD